MSLIHTVLGLAARHDLEVEQMDVKTTFLHGDLKEELYMEQPEGFVVKGKESYVYRLKKSLYGLKQAPRQWYKKFESLIGELGYVKNTMDHCVFVKNFSTDDFVILLLYVDDMLLVGRNTSRIIDLKRQLSKAFAMKDLGAVKNILEMQMSRGRPSRKLWLSKERYIMKVIHRFWDGKVKESGAVAWQSRLQECVAVSITEAEFITATEAYKELLLLKSSSIGEAYSDASVKILSIRKIIRLSSRREEVVVARIKQ
ncbi:Retrovirus-related Pol polyprotein from transposon TNT 1-94-like protein [Drosera capensis]